MEKIIEQMFRKNAYNEFYDKWIMNFALNLDNIWNGHSVRELIPKKEGTYPAIIIGRGPSLIKNNHLEILRKSNFDGTIICTDGILINVLKAGITPTKFKKFYVVTIDAQPHIKNFYNDPIVRKYGKHIKCILSTTVPNSTYRLIKKTGMKIFWIHALFDYEKGKNSFNYISDLMVRGKNHDRGIPAIQTGGNVGTSAWIISWAILKCSPIILLGIDHGYLPDTSWNEIDKYHAIPKNIDKTSKLFRKLYPTVYNPDFDCYCIQDPKFQYYSKALREFIPRAPKWVKTINSTGGGSIFGKGIKCLDFRKYLEKNNFTKMK